MSEHTFVYVIAVRDGNELRSSIKVGISKSPQSRLAALRTGSPLDLVLVHQFRLLSRAMARDVEECFHATQKTHHRQGEWFSISPDDAVLILSLHIRWTLEGFTDLDEDERKAVLEFIGVPP